MAKNKTESLPIVTGCLMSPTRSRILREVGLTYTGTWDVSKQNPVLTIGREHKKLTIGKEQIYKQSLGELDFITGNRGSVKGLLSKKFIRVYTTFLGSSESQ